MATPMYFDLFPLATIETMLTSALFLASLAAALPSQNKPRATETLRFTAEGTFQISVFEDLHYGEGAQTLS
jgi:hypothetical protein